MGGLDSRAALFQRVWIYKTGRFAEERRIFLEEMSARGYGLGALESSIPSCSPLQNG